MKYLYVLVLSIGLINVAIADSTDNDKLQKLLSKADAWLLATDACPADVLTAAVDSGYKKGFCDGQIKNCLNKCEAYEVSYCYNLAVTLQKPEYEQFERYSEALFLRSCELGSISGCTNRAAGMQTALGDEALGCAIRTYKKSCEFDDPWSCTMYGYHLYLGKGVEKNLEQALKALSKSCKNGIKDPACSNAKEIEKRISEE